MTRAPPHGRSTFCFGAPATICNVCGPHGTDTSSGVFPIGFPSRRTSRFGGAPSVVSFAFISSSSGGGAITIVPGAVGATMGGRTLIDVGSVVGRFVVGPSPGLVMACVVVVRFDPELDHDATS